MELQSSICLINQHKLHDTRMTLCLSAWERSVLRQVISSGRGGAPHHRPPHRSAHSLGALMEGTPMGWGAHAPAPPRAHAPSSRELPTRWRAPCSFLMVARCGVKLLSRVQQFVVLVGFSDARI